MKYLVLAFVVLATNVSAAGVVNVEFKFTPYSGDTRSDQVDAVAGKARVFLNGVPIADQEVTAQSMPVLFEEREIAPAVWLPVASLGPAVRKGKNTLHVEFEPNDANAAYKAQLRWNSVMDETVREDSGSGRIKATNQSGEGVEEKQAKGKVVFDREFSADFAADQPWHHYPAVTALEAKDKQALADLIKARSEAFKPNFAGVYELLEAKPAIDLAAVRKEKCLEAAFKAGVRIAVPAIDDLEFMTTGNPEVVVRRKAGDLFVFEPSQFERIKGEDKQMCAAMALATAYPQRLVVVRSPAGSWQVVY